MIDLCRPLHVYPDLYSMQRHFLCPFFKTPEKRNSDSGTQFQTALGKPCKTGAPERGADSLPLRFYLENLQAQM